MKTKTTSFILFLFILYGAYAEEDTGIYKMGKFLPESRTYLFSDRVNVRSSPDINKKNIIANLPIGHPVIIKEQDSSVFVVNDFQSCWYKIEFNYKKKKLSGYIWGGMISIISFPLAAEGKNILLLFGITGYEKDRSAFRGEARIVREGRIISRADFKPMYTSFHEGASFSYDYDIAGRLCKNRGMQKIKNIIIIEYAYPACGAANGEQVFIFDGKDIYYGLDAVNVAEAGVFHFNTKLIFPEDRDGKKDRIISRETTEEFNETKNDYELKSKKEQEYRWEGKKFIPEK